MVGPHIFPTCKQMAVSLHMVMSIGLITIHSSEKGMERTIFNRVLFHKFAISLGLLLQSYFS